MAMMLLAEGCPCVSGRWDGLDVDSKEVLVC